MQDSVTQKSKQLVKKFPYSDVGIFHSLTDIYRVAVRKIPQYDYMHLP